ncbi:CheR family methyltransferase [Heliophilum fasciatum]|uniref:protein-glutamate O-methyltransferase n=1 Tax=Heliophilum fasciatum TaxID=35700 RepID=A0A4R2RNB6_9FIRM|nr:protein-glutamate O-methyltransferase CheR [Heliophilum fasciatum]MCW2278329.1 chemotaxis protein methyltransferase CheR [Heliophilum fasciatum]TCP63797.1 chemotaxis protein methyltransferase CheR [Heliophilum fasciatum]
MPDITGKGFRQLTEYIKNNYGIHLKDEKKTLVHGRLHQILESKKLNSLGEYYEYILADKTGEAVETLLNKITTNHTFFMREAEHFYFFRDKVLPFLSSTVKSKDLRIWSAACSSGEESYTLAMLIDEFLDKDKPNWDAKILATDISDKVLTIARQGIYSNDRIAPLPLSWKIKYFTKINQENSAVIEAIKREVIYRKFNLMDTFPFRKNFHVIFCRNVMIYFDTPTKEALIRKFYNSLEHGGYLFVGLSESVNRETTQFKYIMPSVYRKE